MTELMILSLAGSQGINIYEIVGQIRNDSESMIEFVEAIATTLYDTAGNVVGCSSRFVEGRHLEAGQTGDFQVLPCSTAICPSPPTARSPMGTVNDEAQGNRSSSRRRRLLGRSSFDSRMCYAG